MQWIECIVTAMTVQSLEIGNEISSVLIVVRMDTDILAGTEARITPVLVLTGVTKREQVKRYPYQPYVVLNSIVDIVPQKDNK